MQTSFLRPISGYSGVVRVIARVLRMSRTVAFGEVQIVSSDDELAAHATSTIELH
jgi:acyl-coenzyme A thioesterase PaaI-like protein